MTMASGPSEGQLHGWRHQNLCLLLPQPLPLIRGWGKILSGTQPGAWYLNFPAPPSLEQPGSRGWFGYNLLPLVCQGAARARCMRKERKEENQAAMRDLAPHQRLIGYFYPTDAPYLTLPFPRLCLKHAEFPFLL